jgi:hypothetical protein
MLKRCKECELIEREIYNMMSKEFIICAINKLVDKYTGIKCIYEKDDFSKSHYIEIIPKEYSLKDDNFVDDEMEIIIKFIAQFPYETLVFITEDDLYSITKPEYETIGKRNDTYNSL